MRKLLQSLSWARHGLHTVWKEERNFRIETAIAVIAILAGFILKISTLKWIALLIAITFVLGAEILNTAVEDICNKIEPRSDIVIGKIKDIMAGFVLVSCLASLFLGIFIFF
jgi:undecaprenol kinase